MGEPSTDAQAALRVRQGSGARYDSPNAPAAELVLVRRGTAYFARKLNALSDTDLDGASSIKGWSRRHVIAHVGYHARAMTRLITWGQTGIETPMYSSKQSLNGEIDLGATLSAHALRHLFQHSQIHLNVLWRDLDDAHWPAQVRDMDRKTITLQDTVLLRARMIWRQAISLNNGACLQDIPSEFSEFP
ncbi:MAG: maleylpyruvate isomerase [Paracoccaceae bacterium]|jgi:maleylpyruvate isomerase